MTARPVEPLAIARMGYTMDYDQEHNVWHIFYHGEHGTECVGTVTNPNNAYVKLQRQGWPTFIDAVLCPICVTPEPEGAF